MVSVWFRLFHNVVPITFDGFILITRQSLEFCFPKYIKTKLRFSSWKLTLLTTSKKDWNALGLFLAQTNVIMKSAKNLIIIKKCVCMYLDLYRVHRADASLRSSPIKCDTGTIEFYISQVIFELCKVLKCNFIQSDENLNSKIMDRTFWNHVCFRCTWNVYPSFTISSILSTNWVDKKFKISCRSTSGQLRSVKSSRK